MIQIGIVDDHSLVRSGLRLLFSNEVDLRVVGEAANGRAAIELIRSVELDVLVMDLTMPGQGGLDVLANLRAKAPDLGILVFTGHSENQYAVSLIRKGVSGFLNKECDPAEILKAVRLIALGRRYISPAVAELLARNFDNTDGKLPHEHLTEREFQVFLKLAKGAALREVGEQLSLSVKTISTYRSRLMDKLQLASNSDLTYYAIKHNLID